MPALRYQLFLGYCLLVSVVCFSESNSATKQPVINVKATRQSTSFAGGAGNCSCRVKCYVDKAKKNTCRFSHCFLQTKRRDYGLQQVIGFCSHLNGVEVQVPMACQTAALGR